LATHAKEEKIKEKNPYGRTTTGEVKKAFKQTERVLNAELKKVKGYLKSLDGHDVFNV
jgi:hypothetical protein